MSAYSFFYKILAKPFLKLYGAEITGSENEPEGGGFLVCANHMSMHDVIVLAASLKNQVNYLAKAELFKIPLLSSLIRMLGAYPLNRGHADVSAIKTTIALLKEGKVVGMFPQGTRYKGVDPRTTEPKHGVGMIEYRAKVPVLPVCIETKDNKMHIFGKTKIKIGKPIYYEEFGFESGNTEEFKKASELIFKRITDMLEN
ncbi:MAG: 1-acyl-sn-glycerol-3-phosphate acyltransferase [Ruminococcaceae bacterium]|nr:1-acyl-sn-glycerol-3-phosphate acyltransferase [Oscillospiraceae bacterium]